MSGSAWQIPLSGQVYDPIAGQKANADIAQTQAATGLIGQQIKAAQIQNALAGLRVNAIAPLLGGGGGGPIGGGMPGGAPGMAAPGAPSAGGSPPGLQQASPYGAVMSPFGVAVPGLMAVQALTSADPTKAWESAIATRARTLAQMIAPVDPNNSGEWNRVAQTAYTAGWLSPDDYAAMYNHPEHKQTLLNSFADPNQHIETLRSLAGQGMQLDANGNPVPGAGPIAAAGARAGTVSASEAAAKLPYVGPAAQAGAAGTAAGSGALVTIDVKNPDGSVTPTQVLPKDVAPTLTRFPGSTEAAPGAAGMLGNFKNAVFGQESRFGARPETSSAGARGYFQMLPTTFDQYAKPGEKIDNPTDNATVGQRAIDDLWKTTGGDPMRTAVGYFSGPGNIAPPGSPNPWKQDLRDTDGTRTSDYVKQTMLRMLNAPVAPQPVAGAGITKLSPTGQAGLAVMQDQIKDDSKDVTASLDSAHHAQMAQADLMQIRDLVPSITTGSMANARQSMQNYLSTFAPEAAQRFASAITAGAVDPTKTNATQEFVKLTLKQAGLAERDALGARGGYSAITLYQKAFPNIEMQPAAIKDLTNLMLIAHQRDIDYAQGANQFFQNNRDAFTEGASGGRYNSVQKFDSQFLKSNTPEIYVGAAAALNGKPFGEWAHGLSLPQQQEALRVMWRADPNAVVTDARGQLRHNPALAAP